MYRTINVHNDAIIMQNEPNNRNAECAVHVSTHRSFLRGT